MAGRTLTELLATMGRGLLDDLPARDAGKAARDIQKSAAPATRLPKPGETVFVRGLPKRAQPTKEILDPIGYGGTKLGRPIEAYSPTVARSNLPLLPRSTTTLEDLQGSYLLPLYGDRSSAAGLLTKVGDIDLQRAYQMDGGFDFMRGGANQLQDAIWASGAGVMKPIITRAEEIAKATGADVYGATVTMAPNALDFNKFTPRVAVDLMQQFITKKNAKLFDAELRKKKDMADWPGILSPDADEWMMKASGDQQKAVLRFADTAEAQKIFGAVPDATAAARYATTTPSEANLPSGIAGTAISRFDTSGRGIIEDPLVPHSTYPVQARGQYVGGLIMPVREDLLFRDAFKRYMSPNYVNTSGEVGALDRANATYAHKTQLPGQLVDQQLVDSYMTELERFKRIGLLD